MLLVSFLASVLGSAGNRLYPKFSRPKEVQRFAREFFLYTENIEASNENDNMFSRNEREHTKMLAKYLMFLKDID